MKLIFLLIILIIGLQTVSMSQVSSLTSSIHQQHEFEMGKNKKERESLILTQILIELIKNPEFIALNKNEKSSVIRGFRVLIENYMTKLDNQQKTIELQLVKKRVKVQKNRFLWMLHGKKNI